MGGGLGTTYDVHLGLIGKRVSGPLLGEGEDRGKGRKETDCRNGRKTSPKTNFAVTAFVQRQLYHASQAIRHIPVSTAQRYANLNLPGRLARELVMTTGIYF